MRFFNIASITRDIEDIVDPKMYARLAKFTKLKDT